VKSCFLLVIASAVLSAQIPEALADAGHFLRLKAMMEPRVKQHPEDAEAKNLLSQAEGALGNLDRSLSLAEAAVALAPTNARYHSQLAAACGRIAQTASILKQVGYGRRAKKELDTALELDPNSEGALYGLALFYYAAPSILGGDKQKAKASAELLTKLNPPRGYLLQAKLANEGKDSHAEEEFYKKAIEADEHCYEAKVKLATFYLTRNIKAARRLAKDAQALDPSQAEAWSVMAQIHVATQCWNELHATLTQARAAVPDDLAPYYYSAIALEQSGHFFGWASGFLNVYLGAPAEGNEPTLAEAEKAARRVNALVTRAAAQ
jgi:tetratricopeptide (TPR) repeat protein